jgi:hypothetical protein
VLAKISFQVSHFTIVVAVQFRCYLEQDQLCGIRKLGIRIYERGIRVRRTTANMPRGSKIEEVRHYREFRDESGNIARAGVLAGVPRATNAARGKLTEPGKNGSKYTSLEDRGSPPKETKTFAYDNECIADSMLNDYARTPHEYTSEEEVIGMWRAASLNCVE